MQSPEGNISSHGSHRSKQWLCFSLLTAGQPARVVRVERTQAPVPAFSQGTLPRSSGVLLLPGERQDLPAGQIIPLGTGRGKGLGPNLCGRVQRHLDTAKYSFEPVDQMLAVSNPVALKCPGDILDHKCTSSPVIRQISSQRFKDRLYFVSRLLMSKSVTGRSV